MYFRDERRGAHVGESTPSSFYVHHSGALALEAPHEPAYKPGESGTQPSFVAAGTEKVGQDIPGTEG